MADNLITGGVTTTNIIQQDLQPSDLAPNNYLTIVWKDVQTGKIVNTLDINNEEALEYTNRINSSIDNAIKNNNVSYVAQNKYLNIEAIGKYIAQNNISAGVKRSVVNALISVASGAGKKTPDNVVNLCLNVFGTVADKTARKLGYTDPHEIFSQVAGQNVITVLGELGRQAKTFLDDCISKINGKQKSNLTSQSGQKQSPKRYAGLLLGLTTSDTESYEITIPRRKVEDGSDYSTHLLPQPWKKEFSVMLTNKILSVNFDQLTEIDAIETTKNKMIEIAQSKTMFDIYIRLSEGKMYKKSNVVFSSLSFTKDENSGNGYTATFTIEPFNIFKTKTFISNKKYTSGSNAGSGSGSKTQGTTNRKQANKDKNGKSVTVGFSDNPVVKDDKMKSRQDVINFAKKNGYRVIHVKNGKPEYLFSQKNNIIKIDGVEVQLKDTRPSTNPLTGKSGRWFNDNTHKNKDGTITVGKTVYSVIY